jgi:hypothetical protein
MELSLYLEVINAIFSLLILVMLGFIISFMITKQDIVRSIMFLKGDKLKNPTIIISFGIILLVMRETYKATKLLGINTSAILEELLELGSIIMIFLGILIVFRLLISKIHINEFSKNDKVKLQ